MQDVEPIYSTLGVIIDLEYTKLIKIEIIQKQNNVLANTLFSKFKSIYLKKRKDYRI